MRKLALLLLVARTACGDDAHDFERGFPLIEVHEEKEHTAGAQIFSLAQDARGILFFGGLAGVATYDGAWWSTIALPNDSAVFSVATGKGPEIAVGGIDEFGYVIPGPNGALLYRSLLPQLPPELRNTGDVRSICATRDGFVYAAENVLVAWNGGAPRVLADLRHAPQGSRRCHQAGATTYVAIGTGLSRIERTRIVPAGFEGKTVDLVLPLDDTRALVAVRDEGLFALDGTNAAWFANDASAWLQRKIVVTGARLRDGRIVIGTRQHGILVLARDGSIEQQLDQSAGLPTDVLTAALTDREGSLWLAYQGPFVRVDLATRMTILDPRRGLQGGATSIERHRQRLYVTTSHGLFVADRNSPMFRAIDGLPAPAWDALGLDNERLMVATGDGAFVLDDRGSRRVEGTAGNVVYTLRRSRRDPSRIWMAMKHGVGMLRRDDAGVWRFDRMVPGTPPHSRTLIEDDHGALWVGTILNGVLRIELTDAAPRITTFGSGEMDVARVDGRIVAVRKGTVYEPKDGRLRPDPLLGHVHAKFFAIAQDSQGNVWTNGTPPMFVRRLPDGRFARETQPMMGIDGPRVQMLEAVGDVVWAASGPRLYRFETTAPPVTVPQQAPIIHRVVTADNQPVTASLPHSFGRLHIEFAPASYLRGTSMQYRLVPADEQWSEWTRERSIDYTNLGAGDYTFLVRARGASGEVSRETSWQFTVRPPWYRTAPALLLWAVLAALSIALIVWLRTKALQRQADRLRALVDERTEDLRAANAHLERLSLLDELTGIANRRYFQRALVEDWTSAHEQRQPLALVLLDLDHFKRLNDERGHPAGDAALVQVGRYLAREIRRSGDLATRTKDLVARIGGEEFAVLLTATSEEEAARIAEKLRSGLEDLGAGITASFGVAAAVPVETEAWSALLAEADRAMYAAKNGGRNRVARASEVEGAPLDQSSAMR